MSLKKAAINLSENSLDKITLRPSEKLLEKVVKRLVRKNNSNVPGYAVIENTKDMTKTVIGTHYFQNNLMKGLKKYLLKNDPKLLKPQLKDKHSSRSESLHIFDLFFSGYDGSYLELHMDSLEFLYSSVCYGPYINVKGGNPKIFDGLKYKKEKGSLKEVMYKDGGTTFTRPIRNTYGYFLNKGIESKNSEYVARITNLDFRKLPILIFSNKLVDGIFHGATKPYKKNSNCRTISRPLHYVGIASRE